VKRLVELAKERNIDYKPSSESMASFNDFLDRKGIPSPLDPHIGGASHPVQPPVYNPPPPNNQNYNFPPGPGGASFPPGGSNPPGY
jgi:hypothetical protein